MRALPPRRAAARALRVVFAVQGEGRGHMTQALALAEMLTAAGHEVVGVLVGISRRRSLPAFFRDEIGVPVQTYASPNFVAGIDGAIRPIATAVRALTSGRACSSAFDRIESTLEKTDPDVVVNFYEGLAGAYTLVRMLDAPVVAVGHQFMMGHPEYPLAPGQPVHRAALRAYSGLAGAGAVVRLGLSFYPAPDVPERRLRVVPPLLRRRVFRLDRHRLGQRRLGQRPPARVSLLVYLVEPALAPRLAAWSDRTPGVRLDCFSDVPPGVHSEHLEFHALCGQRFLEHMAAASGVVCTAGFESVSEAFWLGTPALLLPVPNHYEQQCNARDAGAVGTGLATSGRAGEIEQALDAFVESLQNGAANDDGATATDRFRAWTAEAEDRVVGEVERAAIWPARSSPVVAQTASWQPSEA